MDNVIGTASIVDPRNPLSGNYIVTRFGGEILENDVFVWFQPTNGFACTLLIPSACFHGSGSAGSIMGPSDIPYYSTPHYPFDVTPPVFVRIVDKTDNPRRFKIVIGTLQEVAAYKKSDTNFNGQLSVEDMFQFLEYFFQGDIRGDYNMNESNSPQDIFDFLADYFADR